MNYSRRVTDALAEVERLKELVRHCWVHSGYQDCGRKQMDSDMLAIYDETIKSTEE